MKPKWLLSIYETANGWYYVGPFPTEAEARADEAKTRPQTWDVRKL